MSRISRRSFLARSSGAALAFSAPVGWVATAEGGHNPCPPMLLVPTKTLPAAGGPASFVLINGRQPHHGPLINITGRPNWIALTDSSFKHQTSLSDLFYTGHTLRVIETYHCGPTILVIRFTAAKDIPASAGPIVAYGSPQVPGGPGGGTVTVIVSTPSSTSGPYNVGDTTLEPPPPPTP